MKKTVLLLSILMVFSFVFALGQQPLGDKVVNNTIAVNKSPFESFMDKTFMATVSAGFFDYYRSSYSFPAGFIKSNTSGFSPVYARVEYGIDKHISIGVSFSYDVFYCNYNQVYQGFNQIFLRYKTDRVRIFSSGISGYYHFPEFMGVKKLETFAGIGLNLNNISHSSLPSGDSTVLIKDHTVSPCLKVGGRYYFSRWGSLFADAGYDKQCVISLGFSCRFIKH